MTPPTRLTEALKIVNGFSAIGDWFREVTTRLSDLESKSKGPSAAQLSKELADHLLKARKEIEDNFRERLGKMELVFNERLIEIEDRVEAMLESSVISDLQERLTDLEESVTNPNESNEDSKEEPAQPAPVLRQRKISVFGCLPRQYQNLCAALPHLDITHLKKPGKARGEFVFVCAALTKKQEFYSFQSNNDHSLIVNMQGGFSGWIEQINEHLAKHPAS